MFVVSDKSVMHRRQFARLFCKYGPEPLCGSPYVRIGVSSLQLYISYHQQESAGNGHKSAHAWVYASLDACDKGLLIHESPRLSRIMKVHFIESKCSISYGPLYVPT